MIDSQQATSLSHHYLRLSVSLKMTDVSLKTIGKHAATHVSKTFVYHVYWTPRRFTELCLWLPSHWISLHSGQPKWSTMTEQKVKWACDYCTYENWPSAVKCTMCRAHRSMGPIITEEPYKNSPDPDPSVEWSPPRTESGSSLLICPDSSARPRVRPASMAEIASKWSCQMCTYLNWPRAIRCTQCLCQRPRTSSPTESPQTSGSNAGCRPGLHSPVDTCEEYNDRNRLNTHQQHWTCTACAYQNWPQTTKCVVCKIPKPNNQEAIGRAESADPSPVINEQDRGRWRGSCSGGPGQRRSPPMPKREDNVKMDFQRIELAAGAMSSREEQEVDFKRLKQIRNRMRKTDWLFLNACAGEFLRYFHLPPTKAEVNKLVPDYDNGLSHFHGLWWVGQNKHFQHITLRTCSHILAFSPWNPPSLNVNANQPIPKYWRC